MGLGEKRLFKENVYESTNNAHSYISSQDKEIAVVKKPSFQIKQTPENAVPKVQPFKSFKIFSKI